ncbi:hypothetical protein IWX50DRAFT_367507 [Phyllosticta citricarpa]|uniref:Uncharacterized protein n=1 Tax=Phyllosticta citricarpa TaxID=55181 RepID=A0ABR1M3K8_9PEZI
MRAGSVGTRLQNHRADSGCEGGVGEESKMHIPRRSILQCFLIGRPLTFGPGIRRVRPQSLARLSLGGRVVFGAVDLGRWQPPSVRSDRTTNERSVRCSVGPLSSVDEREYGGQQSLGRASPTAANDLEDRHAKYAIVQPHRAAKTPGQIGELRRRENGKRPPSPVSISGLFVGCTFFFTLWRACLLGSGVEVGWIRESGVSTSPPSETLALHMENVTV